MVDSVDVTNDFTAMELAVLKLAKALGLPAHITRLTLTFEASQMPVVRVEFYPDLAELRGAIDELTPQLAEFRLVPALDAKVAA